MGRSRFFSAVLVVVACLGGGGCVGGDAGSPATTRGAEPLGLETEAERYAADRAAILAIAGAYELDLPAASATGSGRRERVWVGVAEDAGDRVVLVRLLVTGEPALVVKAGREDWTYRPASVLRYVGDGVWQREAIEAGDGVWTRTVYTADGGPGYGAVGRWTHDADGGPSVSVWAPTLPTRMPPASGWRGRDTSAGGGESLGVSVLDRVTVRLGKNPGRAAVRWRLEQAVTRLELASGPGVSQASPRTVWVTDHVRVSPPAGSEAGFDVAEAYWRRVAPFWAAARAAWDDALSGDGPWRVRETAGGEPRWRRLFGLARGASGVVATSGGSLTSGGGWREQVRAVLADGVVEPVASEAAP